MKMARMMKGFAVTLACIGLIVPRTSWADDTPTGETRPVVIDVALAEGGTLVGQLVDTGGQPLVDQDVEIRTGEKIVGGDTTNERGEFAVPGLRGGVYQIAAAKQNRMVRAWSPGTAPPSVQQGILVVDGSQTIRGGFGSHFANPWVLAAIAAAAISIPLLIDDDDDDDGS